MMNLLFLKVMNSLSVIKMKMIIIMIIITIIIYNNNSNNNSFSNNKIFLLKAIKIFLK